MIYTHIELLHNIIMILFVCIVTWWICKKIDDFFFHIVENRIRQSDEKDATRLAELWYHADGFPDMAKRGNLQSPEPWIENALLEEHRGDCTKEPFSCMRCHAEEVLDTARWVVTQTKLEKEIKRDRY